MSFLPTTKQPSKHLALAMPDGRLPTIRLQKKKWEPKHLSQKHKSIIALHSQNVSREEIGQVCDCTPQYVSMVVATEKGQQYLRELEQYMDQRLRLTFGKAVDVIHKTLDSEDEEIALKAARLALDANGKLKSNPNEKKSAEDVVAEILARATVITNSNVQIVNK